MSVREGYKQTEIGVIPEDWEVAEQGEVATFYNGRAYKLTEWEEHGTPVIRLQNLTGSGENYYYSNLNLPDHQYCHNGDLLYMWSATFGPVWWKGDKAIFHYHIWKIDTQTDRLDKNFLFYLLDQITMRMKKQSHGSTMIHVTKGGMEKLKIQLPPLQEQQKIAEILSTVDQKIDSIDSKIEETKTLKRGLMQRLLSEGIGHSEFKETEIGRIPVGWEVVKVGSISNLTAGGTPSTSEDSYWNPKEIPWLSSGEVNKKKVFYTDNMISQIGLDNSSAKLLPKHSILIALAGQGKTRGTVAISEMELCTNQSVAAILPSKKVAPYFLYHNLDSRYDELRNMSTGSGGRGGLNLAILKSVLIALPPLEEQNKIAEILSTTDEKLETLRAKKEAFETLKKGLRQKLLTGEVRV